MKTGTIIVFIGAAWAVPMPQAGIPAFPSFLVPGFGTTPGIPSTSQLGSCENFPPDSGDAETNIPCQCPPDRTAFIQRLEQFSAAGNAFGIPVRFSTDVNDMSIPTQLDRINACLVTLQNFDNTAFGVGCPAASAPTFVGIQESLTLVP